MDFILVQERTWLLQHLTCLTFCSLLHLLVLFVDIFGKYLFLTEGPLPNVTAAAISFLPSYFLMKQLLKKLCSPT
ncbi:hypothetical protein V6Z11_D11G086100 [Gossypium hirsutum]